MKQQQALKVIEAVREAARHGTDEPHESVRDWARHQLEQAGLSYYPETPLELETPDEFEACRFPNCQCNMNDPTPYHCEEYRGR